LSAGPLVTLGVPVRNGGAQLEAALRSLQAQTWPALEILISDNASTDGTEAFCRAAAAADPRVRYLRQPADVGAARNFELLAHEATGELFAWCAHDDVRLPRWVEACVTELARHPDAVLCNSGVAFLDEHGAIRPDWADRNFATHGMSRPERMQRLIDHFDWVDVYGLFRREALLAVLPIEPVWGGDVLLSMKLLMRGHFAKVDETLFHYRVRTRPKTPEQTLADVAGHSRGVPEPYTEMARALLRVPLEAADGPVERGEMMRRFLRTFRDVERQIPHPSWRWLLEQEWAAMPRRELFVGHLLTRLAPGMPGPEAERGRRAFALALEGAPRVLVALADVAAEAGELPALLDVLRKRMPGARLALLRPDVRGARALPEVERAFAYRPLREGAIGPPRDRDPELAAIARWEPELAFCLSPRRTRRVDRLATGCGALLGFAIEQPPRRLSRGWLRGAKTWDPNTRWSYLLPPGAGVAELAELLERGDALAGIGAGRALASR
jgi:hypothetical protein